MTLNSINHALALKSFKYAEIMGLFISQAFMNITKVYLHTGNVEKWHSITIDNIDFLLNHKMPANIVNYEGILDKIPDKLKYFMLMGVIDDVIINILKNDLREGLNIIEQIEVREISIPVDKQIQDWVKLNIGMSKDQIGEEFKKNYQVFMKSSNEIVNLTSMKFFLRNRVKKKFKYISRIKCKMMKVGMFFIVLILVLNSCVSTRNWQSTDMGNSFSGSFEELSGKGLLKEIKLNDQTIELDYSFKKSKGDLIFQVESKRKGIIINKKVIGDINESFKYDVIGNDILTIKLIAKSAEGEYNIDYYLK